MATRRVCDLQVFADEAAAACERLPHVLMACDAARAHALLSSAASGLARIHQIGAETGLQGKVVRLGTADSWLRGLIDTPNRIGEAWKPRRLISIRTGWSQRFRPASPVS